MSKKERLHKCFEIFDAMRDAVPKGSNVKDVIHGAEIVIADCIAQSYVGDDVDEKIYEIIADDIKISVEHLKPIIEQEDA